MNIRQLRLLGPVCATVGLALGLCPGSVQAQYGVRSFRKPILVVETEGHHAPVRSLLWPSADSLISAGDDKVVKVWDLAEGPRLARTIRPPIWRGPRGQARVLALSRADADGQALLAVAGFGVSPEGGDLTIYRHPGTNGVATGDPLRRLVPRKDNTVSALAFRPDGRVLISAHSNGSINTWSVPDFTAAALPAEHRGDVRGVAFTPDGSRLVSGGVDGVVRLWDLATRRVVDRSPGGREINALAITPDGRWVIVGRESGEVLQYDARNLRAPAVNVLPVADRQGPIEALALAPDGRRLALSVMARLARTDLADAMTIACDVLVIDLTTRAVTHRRRVAGGLTYGLAFRPDGRRLAYAGGPSQAINLIDLTAPNNAPAVALKGQGTGIYELGFTPDGQTLGLTRGPIDRARPPATAYGFDLGKRARTVVARASLRGAITTYQGWRLRGDIVRYTNLEAFHTDGRRVPLVLDRNVERNWWSYTFLPPGPGHPGLAVALGCESGVVVFALPSGERTRVFTGPEAAVTALAPSPDGRWLASGALDQTVRLHPLANCDQRGTLGATFAPGPRGRPVVREVSPGSYAALMGLDVGDIVLKGFEKGKPFPLTETATRGDRLAPHTTLELLVLRFGKHEVFGDLWMWAPTWVGTTKLDDPALSLMPGMDKEWVLWTPPGYYDTSVQGDARFLGWQTNAPFDQPLPSVFTPVVTHAATMYRRDLIDEVWRAADLRQALTRTQASPEAPRRDAEEDQPPQVRFVAAAGAPPLPPPGTTWVVSVPNPRLGVEVTAAEDGPAISALKVVAHEEVLPLPPLAAPVRSLEREIALSDLPPNQTVKVHARSVTESGTIRDEVLDVRYQPPPEAPPPPPPRQPRTVIVSVGVSTTGVAKLPPVRFADRDARALADFLPQHLLAPGAMRPGMVHEQDRVVRVAGEATNQGVVAAFEDLRARLDSQGLEAGDLVIVFLAAHLLDVGGREVIVASDTGPDLAPTIGARDLAERLGELTDYGCRVVLFLEGEHEIADTRFTSGVKDLTRDLWFHRRVVTLRPSPAGPNDVSVREQRRQFALALRGAFRTASARANPRAPYTLLEFRDAVQSELDVLSNRRRDLETHVPLAVPPGTSFAAP